ncbi:SusD/RagB family nutrient-binding outer membrane lipoprotein [Flectobacillus roseus]|uniref:SusD/RagB family nutrient-binding outer membrane lipoprotein n=1 Tax=Flectobacillus roseus TaxID=502259 RepID=UPI0024B85F26|nr:SusD/RagB family nutrient-binding outer membrane lipoprotein [Flectobacillus roseus]MDI9869516.1 SusD/RagB family nutrient-binding outer membrane lipoprotein [Flectobacillus roseus]
MKKILVYIGLSALLTQGCTSEFEQINTDPNATSAAVFNPNYLLSQSESDYGNTGYSQLLFQSMWSQSLASTFSYYGNGDKYLASGSFIDYQGRLWGENYRSASLAYEMQNLVKDKPELSNLYNVGAIMKVINIARLTDNYGDVPYTQALMAKSGVAQPKYDTQQSIYTGMLTELETALKNLDVNKAGPTADLIYGGDVAKWKKFGYSLMLRLAMRMTKVDEASAKTWAEKAYAGGVFTAVADDAKVLTDVNTTSNATSNALRVADDYREVRWSKTFMDYLKSTNDPRISAIAEVSLPGYANNSNQNLAGDNTASAQIGLPNGYDLNGGATDISKHPQYPGASGTGTDIAGVGKYSRPRTAVYLDRSGVNFLLTYSEVELYLAEAKVRGWNVGAVTAAQHYANGVAASVSSLTAFNTATASDAAIKAAIAAMPAYLATNALNTSSTTASLKQINEQIWVTTSITFNFIETWINWKRSGYPVLTPVNFANNFTGGVIPRRIPYKASESSTNPVNLNAAVGLLSGGNTFTARTWWDK